MVRVGGKLPNLPTVKPNNAVQDQDYLPFKINTQAYKTETASKTVWIKSSKAPKSLDRAVAQSAFSSS